MNKIKYYRLIEYSFIRFFIKTYLNFQLSIVFFQVIRAYFYFYWSYWRWTCNLINYYLSLSYFYPMNFLKSSCFYFSICYFTIYFISIFTFAFYLYLLMIFADCNFLVNYFFLLWSIITISYKILILLFLYLSYFIIFAFFILS